MNMVEKHSGFEALNDVDMGGFDITNVANITATATIQVNTDANTNILASGTWTTGTIKHPVLAGTGYNTLTSTSIPGIMVFNRGITFKDVTDTYDGFIEVVSSTGELSIYPMGTMAWDTANNRLNITSSTGEISFGTGNLTTTGTATVGRFDVLAPATGAREVLFHGQVSDAAEDRFVISNATSVASRFAALLLGSIESTETNIPIAFIGQSDTTRDTGSTPLLSFIGRRYLDTEDWNNPASGFKSVATRPIFAVRNKGAVLMQIEADGQTKILGTTGSNLRLDGNATGQPYLYFMQNGAGKAYIQYMDAGGGTDYLQYDAPKHRFTRGIIILDLDIIPTSDPSNAGQLWRDGTDLKISLG